MKMILNKDILLEALTCVEIATDKKNPILQQFKCVKISFNKGRTIFQTAGQGSSCDYMLLPDILPNIVYDNNKEKDSIVAIADHEKLLHIISKSKKSVIELEIKPDCVIVVAEGKSTLKQVAVSFPNVIPSSDIVPVSDALTASFLKSVWKSIEFTIGRDPSQHEIRGVHYDGDWTATNRYYISVYKSGLSPDTEFTVIPEFESFIKLLDSRRISIDNIEMKKHVDKGDMKHLVMTATTKFGQLRYIISLSSGNFPNIKQIESKLGFYTSNFTVAREDLLDCLKRLEAFLDNENSIVVDIFPSHLTVTAIDDSGQRTTEDIAYRCASIEDPIHMLLNHKILTEICSKNEEETLDVWFGNERTPVKISLPSKIYIITPTIERLNG